MPDNVSPPDPNKDEVSRANLRTDLNTQGYVETDPIKLKGRLVPRFEKRGQASAYSGDNKGHEKINSPIPNTDGHP